MALTHEAGAAVTERTYWAWETTATLCLLGGGRGTGVPTGEERGGAYRVDMRTACCFFNNVTTRKQVTLKLLPLTYLYSFSALMLLVG